MLPTLLGHRLGKFFGGLGSCGAPVSESKPRQRMNILEHFMKGSMTLFGSLSGVLFWERCLELRIRYFMGLLWLVCIGLHRYASLACDCFHEPTLISIERCMLALVCMVCTVVCIQPWFA